MRKLITLAAILSAISTSALAANNTIFSCKAEDGNTVLVKKVGSDYEFSYGSVKFKNPIKKVINNDDSYVATGSGFITSSLGLKNGGTSYTIEFVQPRNNPKEVNDPTLYVSKGNNTQSIQCSNVQHNFERNIMRSQ